MSELEIILHTSGPPAHCYRRGNRGPERGHGLSKVIGGAGRGTLDTRVVLGCPVPGQSHRLGPRPRKER